MDTQQLEYATFNRRYYTLIKVKVSLLCLHFLWYRRLDDGRSLDVIKLSLLHEDRYFKNHKTIAAFWVREFLDSGNLAYSLVSKRKTTTKIDSPTGNTDCKL